VSAEIEASDQSAQIELIPSSGGVFVVTKDGKKLFSKKETGRFPEPGEVLKP